MGVNKHGKNIVNFKRTEDKEIISKEKEEKKLALKKDINLITQYDEADEKGTSNVSPDMSGKYLGMHNTLNESDSESDSDTTNDDKNYISVRH